VTTRREFVRGAARVLGSGGLLGTAPPLLAACARSPTDTGPAPALAPLDVGDLTADGQWRVAPAAGPGGAQILVVRDAVDRFHAVSMRCTHEGCPVNPPAAGIITCPCHGSQFDLTGKVLRGPAQYPLARYQTQYDAGRHRLRIKGS